MKNEQHYNEFHKNHNTKPASSLYICEWLLVSQLVFSYKAAKWAVDMDSGLALSNKLVRWAFILFLITEIFQNLPIFKSWEEIKKDSKSNSPY